MTDLFLPSWSPARMKQMNLDFRADSLYLRRKIYQACVEELHAGGRPEAAGLRLSGERVATNCEEAISSSVFQASSGRQSRMEPARRSPLAEPQEAQSQSREHSSQPPSSLNPSSPARRALKRSSRVDLNSHCNVGTTQVLCPALCQGTLARSGMEESLQVMYLKLVSPSLYHHGCHFEASMAAGKGASPGDYA